MIIGFCGPIGAGKSTAAKHLVNAMGFKRLPFAGTLKAMGRAFGLTDEEVDGDRKTIPSPLLAGKTPREFMQLLGTEFGRNLIDKGLKTWIEAPDGPLPWLANSRCPMSVVNEFRSELKSRRDEWAALREQAASAPGGPAK